MELVFCYHQTRSMSSQDTNQHSALFSLSSLKVGFLNVENLFLMFDQEVPLHYLKLTEPQWQKLSTSLFENKPLQKCIQIARVIKQNSPDIMMLCEVGGAESLKNFNRLFLGDAYDVVLIEGNSDRNIDVGFLIRKNSDFKYDLRSHKERPLSFLYPHEHQSKKTGYPIKGQTHFFSRDCAELRIFNTRAQNPNLIILLTHLKSRLDPEKIDPGGTERRAAELRTCLEIYKDLRLQNPEVPIIFAGDMNGYAGRTKTDAEFEILYKETDLEDVLEVANVSPEKRSTFYQIKNSRVDGRQIDYCFISQNLRNHLRLETAAVYRYKDEFGFDITPPRHLEDKMRLPSDHYPLFFSLEKSKE